jgi:GDSL-like Lipase/Acylhydrolase family
MRTVIVALVSAILGVGLAQAADDSACAVAEPLVHADFALPQVANAIQEQHLDIAVVGTGSSTIGGAAGAAKAFPARLEAALREKLPNVAVKVLTYIKPRQTAADMVKDFERIVAEPKPALVIWQTGTFDAIRGVNPDEFSAALDEGVETLRAKHSDILFINMQYSPRTDTVMAIDNYADAMRFVAVQHEILLFDRFAIMRHWSELGTFDLVTATKNTDTAEHVHDCIGRLLSDLILEAAKMTTQQGDKSNEAH